MITDDVRREVAAKMLEIIHENPDVSLQGMVASAMNECLPEGMECGDRPDGVLVVTSEAFPVDWYSCPVCGAVVGE